ncbi:rhamnogalacturonan acetylesterase [Parasediminibacterium sp. JCM 36343]|uniref:rhamnogalacturonan acetylesterase n=1 Tax=Parasediminibacterium sp. JCM 36343 TaxID=3374279 RepID=UPI00397A8821
MVLAVSAFAFIQKEKKKPTLWLIGDSTVDDGSGSNGLWGWGKFLPTFFDTNRISIRNYAQGGTSTRTFQTGGIWDKKLNKRGMWDTVYTHLAKGDYLIIQFGLNDQGAVADSLRARGTLKGIGEDSLKIYNAVTKQNETVHSFGWYMRRFIKLAKEKGVTVIVCSSIPKNEWKDGKLLRGEMGFAGWALQVAAEEKVPSIDLNNMIADVYDAEGQAAVTEKYHIAKDHTHTTMAGATLNASLVAKSIQNLKHCKLNKYLKEKE